MLHQFIVHLFGALCHDVGLMPGAGDATYEGLKEKLKVLDPDLAKEATEYFQALRGVRMRKTFQALSSPTTIIDFIVVSVLLGAQRFISRFFDRSCRSVIVRARAKGHRMRAAMFDLTNDEYSPVHVVMQFLSALPRMGTETCHAFPLCEVLGMLVEKANMHGAAVTISGVYDRFRMGAVTQQLSLHWRHRMRFRLMENKLAHSVDPDAPLASRAGVVDIFHTKPPCCIGLTAADLREKAASF